MGSYLITGTRRGIGRALAERLAGDGHRVYGIVRPGTADGSADAVLGGRLELDLAAFADYPAALRPWLTALPELDGLVHCAGIVRPGRLADSPPADFTDQFTVNVLAAAELVRQWLPALRAAAGTVLLVNSGSGLNARPPLASYGVSKFALRGYAEVLRQEEPALRVCTIYPGRTATDMQRTVRSAEAGEYQQAHYLRPETVAAVIASVLSLPADATITDLTLRPTGQPGPSSPDAHP
ncbi:MAG TPA: SDR family oxidoreductase [Jatrophihabitans sp.]|jgi:NAD(P)-dependent dehydrogenase (short-subunit alcohol dehydrogenase family)|nr:SDR family oxidoreductase [Jatrophihabitans sp.]